MISRILSAITFILLLSSCGTTRTDAPPPESNIKQAPVPKQLSTINIPIILDLKDIENRINQEFNGVLYDDNSFDNNSTDNLILKVTKLDQFNITSSADQFFINAPLEIYVKGRLKKSFSLLQQDFGIDQTKDATFRINVKIKTNLSLSPDWDVKTISEAGFDWRDRPFLEVGPLKIPIGSIIESVMNGQIKEINKQLDREITNNIKIKPLIEQYWKDMQAPILINETYKSYLQIVPENVFLSPIRSNGKMIFINIGMKTELSLYNGKVPFQDGYKPLPKLQTNSKPDSTFNLFLIADIDYELATALALKEFQNKEFVFENGKQKVKITDLKIFASGNKVAMRIGMNGSTKKGIINKKFKGDVYALGVPVYNESTQMLSVTNFDFDVKSKDVLVGAAEWMFKGSLKKTIESKLVYSLKDELSNLKRQAQDAMSGTNINKNIQLNGRLETLQPSGIYVGEKSVQVLIKASGDLRVQVKN